MSSVGLKAMQKVSKLSLLLPLALFSGAVVIDMNIMSGSLTFASSPLRQMFIIIAYALSLPLIYSQKWASDRNVLRGLRSLFFLILFTYLAYMASQKRFTLFGSDISDEHFLYSDFRTYWLVMSWAFFATIFALLVLGTMRNLIFIKQKKTTSRNFNLLMIFLFLYSIADKMNLVIPIGFGTYRSERYLHYVLLFILINLMVINAFRVSWINYLNKKQKLAGFWGALILIPIQLDFCVNFHRFNPVALFSPSLGVFVYFSMVFLAIYLISTLIALIAHLPTAKLYDRKMSQISSMLRLSRTVSSEFEFAKLVQTIVRLTVEVTEADFSWLELADPSTNEMKLTSSTHLSAREQKNRIIDEEATYWKWIRDHREPYLSNQVAKNHHVKKLRNWKRDLNSIIIVPLLSSGRIIGLLYAGSKMEFAFEQDDIDMLKAFSEQAVVAIENARLIEASIVKERLEQELEIAHDAQMKLLPKRMPAISGFDVDAICITANEVGGDYYDFFQLNGKLAVVIGDVSGKGPSAAFYMAELKGVVSALAFKHNSPKRLLIEANEILYEHMDRQTFVSLIYGIVDPHKKRFTFCRAGHCPVLMANGQDGVLSVLEPKGLGLGLDRGPIFEQAIEEMSLDMEPGTTLFLYTDGATEARDKNGEEFGEDRLSEAFVKHYRQTAMEIKSRILTEIKDFLQGEKLHDDMTCVIIKMNELQE